MSRYLGQLTLDLVARINGFTQPMNQASRTAQKTSSDISRSFDQASRSVISSLRGLAGPLATVFSVRQVSQYATSYTELQNRLRLVTQGTVSLGKATSDVFAIATRTSQAVSGTATVYQRFAQNAGQLGLTLDDVAGLTETVSQAVAISGASASSAEAALVQFGQALASGTLRGEELNSVLEQTPGLAQAIAAGLGVGVGQLRALAQEGKITSQELIRALRNAAEGVQDQFNRRVLTIPQALTNIETSLIKTVGTLDTATGSSTSLARGLNSIAEAIASADVDGFIRDLEIVAAIGRDVKTAVFDPLYGALKQVGDWLTTYGPMSMTKFVQATAKELDVLAAGFKGVIGGISRAFDAVAQNIENYFANAFDAVLNNAASWVNAMISRINNVTGSIGLPEIPGVEFGNREGNRPIYDIGASFAAGFERYGKGVGAQDYVENILGGISAQRAAKAGQDLMQAYNETLKTRNNLNVADVATGKKKLSDGERELKQLNEQIARTGEENKLKALQLQIDAGLIKFDNERQKNSALASAATLDFITEYNEKYKETQDLTWKYAKVVKDTSDSIGEFTLEAARNIQSSLGDGLYSVLTGSFSDIGRSFAQMVARMMANAASAQLAKLLFGDFDKTGNIGGWAGQLFNLFRGPITAGAGVTLGGAGNALGSLEGLFGAGFASGGWTGGGGMNSVAGVVHGQEYVLNANATRRIGVGTLDSINSGKGLGDGLPIIENHGVDLSVQRDAQNRVRVVARQQAFDVLAVEGPGMVASEVGTPNRQGWKAVNRNFKVTPRR